MNYLQNSNRFTDFENKLIVTKGERWGGGINQEFEINIHILLYIKQITKEQNKVKKKQQNGGFKPNCISNYIKY